MRQRLLDTALDRGVVVVPSSACRSEVALGLGLDPLPHAAHGHAAHSGHKEQTLSFVLSGAGRKHEVASLASVRKWP